MTTDASTGNSFNRFNYANNSPYRYIDADGRVGIDVVFVAYDIYALATEGATATNVVALGLDLASTAGFGFGAGEIYRASHAVEAVAHGAEAAAHGSEAAAHGAEAGLAKETGSYTNLHESGKTYSGKGTRERSQVSGRRVEKETGDKHVATEWKQSKDTRAAFKDESKRIDANGGVKSADNYNKVESPGKKYRDRDGQ